MSTQLKPTEIPVDFQQRVNNALVALTAIPSIYCQIERVFRIGESEDFFMVYAVTPQRGYLLKFLVFDTGWDLTLFLDGSTFRGLVIDPMTRDVKHAIRDYHAIGHGGSVGYASVPTMRKPEGWPDGVIPWDNPIL